jgi:hypothetical protein
MPSLRSGLRVACWLVAYLALVVWLTWPLASSPFQLLPCTNIACVCDTPYSAWALAWVSHALVTHAPLANANIYFPDSHALFYGQAGFGAVPYFLLPFLATGNAAFALNVTFVASVALTATALHWVVWRWTNSALAGAIAAWCLLTSHWILWGFVATAPQQAVLQYVPLIAYLAAKPRTDARTAGLLLVLVALQCLTDPVYVAPGVLAPLAVLAFVRLVRPGARRSGRRLVLLLALVPLCLAPLLSGYMWVRAHNPSLATQSVWTAPPWFQRPAPTDLSSLFWRFEFPTTMAPPMLALLLAGSALALRHRRVGHPDASRRGWAHAALWAIVGTLISLSPVTTWGFHGPRILLPQTLLAATTSLYQIVRDPSRLGVTGMMGLCLLAGLAFAEVAHALAVVVPSPRATAALRGALALGVAALLYRVPPVMIRRIPARYPTQPVPRLAPPLQVALAATEGPLLVLPARSRRMGNLVGSRAVVSAMYHSTRHWRPLVDGYSSYWPADYPARMALADALPSSGALRRLVCQTGVRTVLVYLQGLRRQRVAFMRARRTPLPGLTLVADRDATMLFRVDVALPPRLNDPACLDTADRPTRGPTSS